MTYFTYFKEQYSDHKDDGQTVPHLFGNVTKHIMYHRRVHRYDEPPKKIPMVLPKPKFMPSRLVRVSDMKVVRGSEVNEGYCTLSYSWSQSGELVTDEATGEINRIDQSMHRIVLSSTIVQGKNKFDPQKIEFVDHVPQKIKHVKFEGLIQEICKDFNVKYIWYDQMCINQNNKEEKHREIRQMHKIYRNAYCAIVLVPELNVILEGLNKTTGLPIFITNYATMATSQWMTRVWTLEETLMSPKMLFIGEYTHTWWHQISPQSFPIFQKNDTLNVATILHYAHSRTSSKEHDHVFALANSIPEVMKKITIDYDQDINELMIRFYGILAEKDLSILCFGPHRYYTDICAKTTKRGKPQEYLAPIQKYDLPSWTGVDGEHLYEFNFKTSFKNYTVTRRTMQIKCTGITNDSHNTVIIPSAPITPADLPPFPHYLLTGTGIRFNALVVPVRLQDWSNGMSILVYCELSTFTETGVSGSHNNGFDYNNKQYELERSTEKFSMLTHFLPIRKEDIIWVRKHEFPVIKFDFDYLAEHLDASSHYTLLTGVQFMQYQNVKQHAAYPVIKKNGNYYKAIGLCQVHDEVGHFPQYTTSKEQIYEIQ